MLPYLSMDIHMFQEVNFELQETDSVHARASNYTSMFLHQMEVFVIIILQIFLQCIRQNIYKQLIVYCISEFSICLYQQKNISLLLQQQEKSLPT